MLSIELNELIIGGFHSFNAWVPNTAWCELPKYKTEGGTETDTRIFNLFSFRYSSIHVETTWVIL
jgi:hypothetical protein